MVCEARVEVDVAATANARSFTGAVPVELPFADAHAQLDSHPIRHRLALHEWRGERRNLEPRPRASRSRRFSGRISRGTGARPRRARHDWHHPGHCQRAPAPFHGRTIAKSFPTSRSRAARPHTRSRPSPARTLIRQPARACVPAGPASLRGEVFRTGSGVRFCGPKQAGAPGEASREPSCLPQPSFRSRFVPP